MRVEGMEGVPAQLRPWISWREQLMLQNRRAQENCVACDSVLKKILLCLRTCICAPDHPVPWSVAMLEPLKQSNRRI